MLGVRTRKSCLNWCVGCGICQYRCHTKYVVQLEQLDQSAIVVVAENEHRMARFPGDPSGLEPRPKLKQAASGTGLSQATIGGGSTIWPKKEMTGL